MLKKTRNDGVWDASLARATTDRRDTMTERENLTWQLAFALAQETTSDDGKELICGCPHVHASGGDVLLTWEEGPWEWALTVSDGGSVWGHELNDCDGEAEPELAKALKAISDAGFHLEPLNTYSLQIAQS